MLLFALELREHVQIEQARPLISNNTSHATFQILSNLLWPSPPALQYMKARGAWDRHPVDLYSQQGQDFYEKNIWD